MDGYNHRDMQKMQRDAEQRIRDMQKKADRAVAGNDMPPIPNFVRTNTKPHVGNNNYGGSNLENTAKQNQTQKPMPQKENKGINLLKMFNFSNLKFDRDIMLVVVMILLLSTEENDELLLLALVYIML